MNGLYDDILELLEPYSDKVFIFPLDRTEVAQLEQQVGQQYPDFFRAFLMRFGIKQDFLYELSERPQDYVDNQKYLPGILKSNYVAIGNWQRESDTLLLNVSDLSDQRIYEYRRENADEAVPLQMTFRDLVRKGVNDLIETYPNRPLNIYKHWHVEFSIKTNDEQSILEAIDAVRTSEWVEEKPSPAGVHSFVSEIELNSIRRKFLRSEYAGWKTPHYYFSFAEPALTLKQGSFIEALDDKLKRKFEKYTLIDYGILALPEDTDKVKNN